MDSRGRKVIVCENGTGFVKCGYPGSVQPAFTIPTIVGRPRTHAAYTKLANLDLQVGGEAIELRHALELSYPMVNGMVQNWEDMCHVWDYSFGPKKMNIDCKDCKIFLLEGPMNPIEHSKKIIEIMFEMYQFGGTRIGNQALFSLYYYGLLTGVVVDSGFSATRVYCVYESNVLHHRRLPVAGRNITKYLMELLHRYTSDHSLDFESVRMIKEKLCYVAYDLEEEQRLASETTFHVEQYKLPGGKVIKIGEERFQAPEALFQPNLLSVYGEGIAEFVFNTIEAADEEIRPQLYKNIVLCGGTSRYPGLSTRLERDVRQLYLDRVLHGDTKKIERFTICVEDRQPDAAFKVALDKSTLPKNRENFWFSREEYWEKGLEAFENIYFPR